MTNMIEELRKKQSGYEAARAAIEATKPEKVKISKAGNENREYIKVSYNPADETFCFEFYDPEQRYDRSFCASAAVTKLMFAALKEFFEGGADENIA